MSLPVDDIFSELSERISNHSRVILQAAPGAGKSTRLPLLLLQQGQNKRGRFGPTNQIIILEPRRVAARQIAAYLAKQLGEPIGETVGLVMRGENQASQKTALTVITDGVLVKMLQADPELDGIGLVIFDEFHERALASDLALALTLDAQELNEELSVLIMSATIDTIALSSQLEAQIVCAEGRQYPVDIKYVGGGLVPTLGDIVTTTMTAINNHDSSVLVFLTGVSEIKAVHEALLQRIEQSGQSKLSVYPLYGGLSLNQQVNAIAPAAKGHRKVVLATNIAQTSLTIEGVDVVVDAGQEKIVQYQPRMNTEVLTTQATSKAAAEQRAGRAGRLRPGVCYRIGSAEHWQRRAAYDVAEIERVDLSQLLLEVQAWGAELDQLFWPTQPDAGLVAAAVDKLATLGFWEVSSSNQPFKIANTVKSTALLETFKTFNSELRVTRVLHFVLHELHDIAPQTDLTSIKQLAALVAATLSDNSTRLPTHLFDILSLRHINQPSIKKLLIRYTKQLKVAVPGVADIAAVSDWLSVLIATAFPDRIAMQTKKRWKMSNGGAVEFHSSTPPAKGLIVVVDFVASQYGHYIQSYIDTSFKELQTQLPKLITAVNHITWSPVKKAPVASKQKCIGKLVIEDKPAPLKLKPEEWTLVWTNYVKEQINNIGVKTFDNQSESVATFLERVALVKQYELDTSFPVLSLSALSDNVDEWLGPYVQDVRSVKQLLNLNFIELIETWIGWDASQQLKTWCPLRYKNPAGKWVKIHYLSDTPKISVRLQEMFGAPQSPSICLGKQPLLIELLSPAQRPLQVTQDLANFWINAYHDVKKEMKGRYPKHRWPDDPANETAGPSIKKRL